MQHNTAIFHVRSMAASKKTSVLHDELDSNNYIDEDDLKHGDAMSKINCGNM